MYTELVRGERSREAKLSHPTTRLPMIERVQPRICDTLFVPGTVA